MYQSLRATKAYQIKFDTKSEKCKWSVIVGNSCQLEIVNCQCCFPRSNVHCFSDIYYEEKRDISRIRTLVAITLGTFYASLCILKSIIPHIKQPFKCVEPLNIAMQYWCICRKKINAYNGDISQLWEPTTSLVYS